MPGSGWRASSEWTRLRRLADVGQAEEGLILCFDADCRCTTITSPALSLTLPSTRIALVPACT